MIRHAIQRPLLLTTALLSISATAPVEDTDNGRTLAAQVMQAVGGQDVWNDRSWNLAFDFVMMREGKEAGRISHQWNRSTGEYIVRGTDKEGKRWKVHFANIDQRLGTATIDGAAAPAEKASQMIEMGYGRYINDTYWLLMPFKLLDPGVRHEQLPDTSIGGRRHHVLTLSFDRVGLTPGDRYWLYIDPETKYVKRWRYLLESGRRGESLWDDYRRFDKLTLPLLRQAPDGTPTLRFENVRVGRFPLE